MNRSEVGAMLTALVCILTAAALAVGTNSASAQELPTGLTGEALFAGPNSPVPQGTFSTVITCAPGGNQGGTINFTADGVAVGPYPGTFHETGTVVVQPEIPSVNSGPLTSTHAQFTITSGTTTITGTKDLRSVMPPEGLNQGNCTDIPGVKNAGFDSFVSYQAMIQTPTGSFNDSGNGRINGNEVVAGTFTYSTFVENFFTSNGVVPACNEDEQGDDDDQGDENQECMDEQ